MSYQNMNIYRTAFQLTVHIEQCVREFRKCDKYTTGSELRKMTTELLYKVATFNDLSKEEKYQFCFDLRQELNRFQIKMALCEELNVFRNYKSRAYFLQLDVANFFMSINRDILWKLLNKGLDKQFREESEEKENIRKLLKILVFHDPTESYINKARPEEWAMVPPNKSLFHCDGNVGLPIGNLTSQFFANVYLNELDQFIKHTLKVRCYVRYVDDFIILHESKEQLSEWLEIIRNFLEDKLKLRLKKAVKLAGISTGINFLGYVQHVHYRLVRRRVINNFKMKLEKWARKEKAGKFGWSDLCDIRSLLNSYLSHSGKANAHRIFNKVLKDNKWILKYFDFRGCKAVLKPEFKAEREKQIWDFIKGGQNGEIY